MKTPPKLVFKKWFVYLFVNDPLTALFLLLFFFKKKTLLSGRQALFFPRGSTSTSTSQLKLGWVAVSPPPTNLGRGRGRRRGRTNDYLMDSGRKKERESYHPHFASLSHGEEEEEEDSVARWRRLVPNWYNRGRTLVNKNAIRKCLDILFRCEILSVYIHVYIYIYIFRSTWASNCRTKVWQRLRRWGKRRGKVPTLHSSAGSSGDGDKLVEGGGRRPKKCLIPHKWNELRHARPAGRQKDATFTHTQKK